MYQPNLNKSVALHVPGIIRVLKKFVQSLDTPTLPFLQNFEWAFVRMDRVNAPAKFQTSASVLEIIAIEVLGVANPQSWGRGCRSLVGGRRWYRSKERW